MPTGFCRKTPSCWFAKGLRVEHPQELIGRDQCGSWWTNSFLPPAEHIFAAQVPVMDRGPYTFCMCPGERVVGVGADAGWSFAGRRF